MVTCFNKTIFKKSFYIFFFLLYASSLFSTAQLNNVTFLQQPCRCLTSLFFVPIAGCLPWVKNVYAHPYYEKSRDLIFTGGGDRFLHVIDASTFKTEALLNTGSRVVTKIAYLESEELFAFGTENGLLIFIDPYSYKIISTIQADAKINDDVMFHDKSLFFSTTLGTVYRIDADKKNIKMAWMLTRPMDALRIKLHSQSNLLVYKHPIYGNTYLIAPQAEGIVSLIDIVSGAIKENIVLKKAGMNYNFPDIVSPMVIHKDKLYVASYGAGLFEINLVDGHSTNHRENLEGITNIVFDVINQRLVIANSQKLVSLTLNFEINWEKDISLIRTQRPKYPFPFSRLLGDNKEALGGGISGISLKGDNLILSSYEGGIGFFDITTGNLRGIKGSSVGFGPMEQFEKNIFLVSRTGRLYHYSF